MSANGAKVTLEMPFDLTTLERSAKVNRNTENTRYLTTQARLGFTFYCSRAA